MDITQRQIKDKACTVCDGLQPYGKGVRAVSKLRCDTCKDGSNWRLKEDVLKERMLKDRVCPFYISWW